MTHIITKEIIIEIEIDYKDRDYREKKKDKKRDRNNDKNNNR
jgi:hypothetical protein